MNYEFKLYMFEYFFELYNEKIKKKNWDGWMGEHYRGFGASLRVMP